MSSQPLKRSSYSQAWRDKVSNKRHREPFATIILYFYTALQLTKYLHPLSHPICPVSPLAAQANCPESGCPHSHLPYYSSRTNSNDHSIHEVDNTAAKPARKTIRLGISSLCLVTGKMMLYWSPQLTAVARKTSHGCFSGTSAPSFSDFWRDPLDYR